MNRVHCLLLWPLCFLSAAAAADHPLLPGYLDYPQFTEQLQELAERECVALSSLGTTRGGREIHQVTIAQGEPDRKPGFLIVGGMDANRPVGSELAVRLAEKLAGETELLSRVTFYLIPRANPDGVERVFQQPYRDSQGNGTRTDDDRDGEVAEDGPDDLDGDGMITFQRVYRTGGAFRADPEDPRLNAPADAEQGKPGEFDVFAEGVDNDGDEAWNEDPGDGVAFNRNFTFQYQPFQPQTGPHAVSEVETRAIADFAWDHPNIAVVLCLGSQDNLTQVWKANPQDRGPIRTSVTREDADYYGYLAKQFQETVKLASGTPDAWDGSLLAWSYFHYGRWALGSRGWRIPKDEANGHPSAGGGNEESSEPSGASPGKATEETEPPPPAAAERPFLRGRRSGERRGRPGPGREPSTASTARSPEEIARDRDALAWMDAQQIDGFAPWTTVDHADFPNLRVDVGGMRPWWRDNPPIALLDELSDQHCDFVKQVVALLPRLELEPIRSESLGHGIFRVIVRVANLGYLPTSTNLGNSGRLVYPVQVELVLPEGAQSLTQPLRRRIAAIPGGEAVEQEWLVQVPDQDATTITVRAHSIMVGTAVAEQTLSPNPSEVTP